MSVLDKAIVDVFVEFADMGYTPFLEEGIPRIKQAFVDAGWQYHKTIPELDREGEQ